MFKEYSPSLTYTLVLSLWDIFRLAPLKINKEMEIKAIKSFNSYSGFDNVS